MHMIRRLYVRFNVSSLWLWGDQNTGKWAGTKEPSWKPEDPDELTWDKRRRPCNGCLRRSQKQQVNPNPHPAPPMTIFDEYILISRRRFTVIAKHRLKAVGRSNACRLCDKEGGAGKQKMCRKGTKSDYSPLKYTSRH